MSFFLLGLAVGCAALVKHHMVQTRGGAHKAQRVRTSDDSSDDGDDVGREDDTTWPGGGEGDAVAAGKDNEAEARPSWPLRATAGPADLPTCDDRFAELELSTLPSFTVQQRPADSYAKATGARLGRQRPSSLDDEPAVAPQQLQDPQMWEEQVPAPKKKRVYPLLGRAAQTQRLD